MANMTKTSRCDTCRFHTKRTLEKPLWFEGGGDQIRTVDVDAVVCLHKESPRYQHDVTDENACLVYEGGKPSKLPPELQTKLDAAQKRLGAKDRER